MNTSGWDSLDSTFDCECGQTHSIPIKVCHTGPDAAEKLVRFAKDNFSGPCLLVSDETTREIGEKKFVPLLRDAGFDITERVFPADIEATIDYLMDQLDNATAQTLAEPPEGAADSVNPQGNIDRIIPSHGVVRRPLGPARP